MRIILIISAFLLVLTGIRMIWLKAHKAPPHPQAAQGVLDLRGFDFANNRPITLNGEWRFYPGQFPDPDIGASDASTSSPPAYMEVPGNWSEKFPVKYGTYRLRVLVNDNDETRFGFRVTNADYATALYVNGRLLAQAGQPAETAENYVAMELPFVASATPSDGVLDVMIRVANFNPPPVMKSGLVGSVIFGYEDAVERARTVDMAMELLVCVIVLLHGVYALFLYFVYRKGAGLVFFILMAVCTLLVVLVSDSRLLFVWFPTDHLWMVKITTLSYSTVSFLMLALIMNLMPGVVHARWLYGYFALYAAYALFVAASPLSFVLAARPVFSFISLSGCFAMIAIALIASLRRREGAIFLLAGTLAVTSSSIWGGIKGRGIIEHPFYPFDLIAAFLCFGAFWFHRYFRTNAVLEQMTAKLQAQDKQKDDFLANTSHELRNPLHGMLNLAQHALGNPGGDNRRNLELLMTIGKRMSLMLNDLLDIGRLKERGIRLQRTSVRLQSVASGVLDMLRLMTEGKPLRFELDIPDDMPAVDADENRLIQILYNLIHNAVKYTTEGTITVKARVAGGQARISVIDTGVGIDEATQRRIFQPYEQGEVGFSSGGIGLGLSICKQLVELHGSALTLRSTPGQGATFAFALPLAGQAAGANDAGRTSLAGGVWQTQADVNARKPAEEKNEQDADASVVAAGMSGSEKVSILAVDDDPVNLTILTTLLPPALHDIVAVTSGKEALARLDEAEWDLVIADVMMPEMSGYELTRAIRRRYDVSDLPVLLLTARSRPEDVEAGFLAGANDYVTKPVDALELKARVRALTGLKQSISERLRTEAALLQAQIQPHFLFNTLNTVTALSEVDTVRMRALLQAFGSYLRTSFDSRNLERVVSLDHELQLVRSYLFIEKERFDERLQVVWEIEHNIQLRLPPLTIQPLVENAVRHGILRRSSGGKITIRIVDEPDCAVVTIEDNGVGMSEEALRRVRAGELDGRSGIGLINTDRRLKHIYGSGLTIRSVPGQGTTVGFTIPKRRPDGGPEQA